jgi:hypothetical protein
MVKTPAKTGTANNNKNEVINIDHANNGIFNAGKDLI